MTAPLVKTMAREWLILVVGLPISFVVGRYAFNALGTVTWTAGDYTYGLFSHRHSPFNRALALGYLDAGMMLGLAYLAVRLTVAAVSAVREAEAHR